MSKHRDTNCTHAMNGAHAMNAYDIESIVNDIYTSPSGYSERKSTFTEKYPEFVHDHPILFEMVCLPRFNMDTFMKIYSIHGQMQRKKRTLNEMHGVHYNMNQLHEAYKKQISKDEYFV